MQHSVVVEDNSNLVPQRTWMLPISTTCPPWPDVLGGLPWRDVGRLAAPTASNLLCGNQGPALRPQAGQSPRPRGLKGRPSEDHVAGQSPREPGLYLPGEPGHSCAAPRCQPARRHSVAARALHGVGPPCGATLCYARPRQPIDDGQRTDAAAATRGRAAPAACVAMWKQAGSGFGHLWPSGGCAIRQLQTTPQG